MALIATSSRRLLGRDLVADDSPTALWEAPLAIVAHGLGADPVFFFANRAALAAFETTPAAITAMPSRLSAEPLAREERQALLDRVSAEGFGDARPIAPNDSLEGRARNRRVELQRV